MTENNSIEQMLMAKLAASQCENEVCESEESVLSDPNVTQHVVRTVDESRDTIVAYFRCQFDIGQQRYALNYVVHPAFDSVPRIEATPLDISDMRIRVTECMPYGMRVELILSEPATETTTALVELIASASFPSSSSK